MVATAWPPAHEVFLCPESKQEQRPALEDCGCYAIRVPSEEFMAYAKSVGGSPSSVLQQLVGQTLMRLYPESELPLKSFIPVSVRGAMGNPNSLLHQVVHTTFECEAADLASDASSKKFNEEFRVHLKEFMAPDNLRMMCGVYHGIIDGFKQAIAAGVLGMVESAQNSEFSVEASHLGTLAAGDYGRRIHMDVFGILGEKGVLVYMMEIGGEFCIFVTVGAKNDAYARDMASHMVELGMSSATWLEA